MTASLSPVSPSGLSTRGAPMADAEVVAFMRDPYYRIGWLERTLKEALRSLQAINHRHGSMEAAYRIQDIEHTLRLSSEANRLEQGVASPLPAPGSATLEKWRRTFANETAAEQYLAERGFSVGRRQGGAERGILLGSFDIQKWRNLTRSDRAELHGVLQRSGHDRDTPAVVTIFSAAPIDAHQAIRRADAAEKMLPVAAAGVAS